MHPGAWLAWATAAALVGISTTNPFYLLPLAAAAGIVHSARHGEGSHVRSFRVFVAFGLFALVTRTALVVFGEVSTEAVAAAALEGLRLAVLLTIFGTFNSVSDPFGVVKLAPRRFHEPALAAALALSIAPRTIDAASKVREAQRMRGLNARGWRTWPALAVPVLETGMEEAVTLAESMDARGHGRGARTRYRPSVWRWDAWAVLGAAVLGAVTFLLVGRAEPLTVSTYPLIWPAAHPLLVVVPFLFTVPAFMPRKQDR